jgi:hypothetical protein
MTGETTYPTTHPNGTAMATENPGHPKAAAGLKSSETDIMLFITMMTHTGKVSEATMNDARDAERAFNESLAV